MVSFIGMMSGGSSTEEVRGKIEAQVAEFEMAFHLMDADKGGADQTYRSPEPQP